MKVLLINPPAFNEVLGPHPAFVAEEEGHYPPLGLLYLAGYLLEHTDFQVEVLDAQVEELSYPELEERVRRSNPDVVGVTAMTFTLIDVVDTLDAVKRACPDCVVVLGGPHVHIYPEESLDLPGVDYLVVGEGEVTFARLLEDLDRPALLREIPGLVFRDDGEVVNTGIPDYNRALDELPYPPRELVPVERYTSILARRSPITTMFTSRGCPYKCLFCDRPHLGKRFRAHSAEYVVDEMEASLRLGIKEFIIYDDTFTVNRRRVLDICDRIVQRGLEVSWDIRARVDNVDEEVLGALRRAGCERIHYGVEAGTDRILEVLNKGITVRQALDAFKATRRVGIQTLAYFMLGVPSETREDVARTVELAKRLEPDYVLFSILCPYPATEVYREGLRRGLWGGDPWREFARSPGPDFQPPIWNENFTREELMRLQEHAYKSFYGRPTYAARRMLKLGSLGELKGKVRAAWKLFFG